MKDYKKNQYIIIFVLLLSLALIFTNFFIEEVPPIVTYFSFAFGGFAISLEIIYLSFYNENKRLKFLENRMKFWNSITYRVKNAGEISFNEMPIGIVVFNDSLDIEWANNFAKEIFLSPLIGRNIKNIDKDLTEKIGEKNKEFNVVLYGKTYACTFLINDNVLYLTDITEKLEVLKQYKNRMLALGVINLDNLEIALSNLDAQERAHLISNLIGILSEWAEKLNISIKGYIEERYLLILDYHTLELLIKSNFDILDKIKDYCSKENLRLTASIGLACGETDAMSLMKSANDLLDLALSRGGNQAVVKINEEIFYFGAKSESFEARTSVNIRIKTEELCDFITKSSHVIIMTHEGMDADAFGAAVGLRRMAKSLGREAHIVFDEKLVDETVVNIYESITKEHVNYLNAFITPKDAIYEMTDDTLLIIVDCQYQNILFDEKVYKRAKKVAIIDHHRRNSLAINSYAYLYTQPSSSSSVELIMEMVDYLDIDKLDLSNIEATWMLMGITVDTNNFIYRTTSRTFNVMAKLQEFGADMAKVQRYLRENFGDYVKKVSILSNIEIVDGIYGIVICDDEIYQRSFLAKIADDLISSVNEIKIAFCIGKISSDTVGISARSLDEANVQVIMERLGGGGHFNNAATQIKDVTINEAKQILIKSLQENVGEGEKSMKIILTKDVKGKGKTNEIIDIPNGHANFLIRSGQAIEATSDNIKQLEYEKMMEKQEAEKRLKDAQELKKIVDVSPIKVGVKVGKSGKLFGSVSTKQIVDEYKNQYNIDLDKRKILYDKEIDTLGTYKIPIQLHKEVTATIVLYVIEKE